MRPGGITMESLSNMDSAGSCESVISMNSGYSEDSMEHLSAEERACLMYLEETIEALEIQEDSGLSNDEPDLGLQAGKMTQTKVNDVSSLVSEVGGAEHHALNQTPEPQPRPVSAANAKDVSSSSPNLTTQRKPAVTGIKTPPAASQTKVLCVTTDANGNPKIVASTSLHSGQSTEASETDLGLIPPPSDFMDKPHSRAHLVKVKDLPPSAGISSSKPGATIDLEKLRQRASAKKTSGSSSMTLESPNMAPPELSLNLSPPAVASGQQISPPPDAAEPRSPPAVAPKPKKLPANIFLKTHKTPVVGSDGNSGHSAPASSDRGLSDHQRIRLEALRKLGLLKGDEAESGPALSPSISPKTRRSWGAPPSPMSPGAPHTPPLTPSNIYVSSPAPASVPLQSVAAVSPSTNSTDPDILPAPAAFSDPVKGGSEVTAHAQANTPPLTTPALTKKLTPPKIIGVKSATLEGSSSGLSSLMARQDFSDGDWSPRQLRNSRPRPASLGSGKEFSNSRGEGLQAGRATNQASQRSLPAFTALQHSRDSQKLPRSEGISVLICPRSDNEEDRRKALRKLGLLRD